MWTPKAALGTAVASSVHCRAGAVAAQCHPAGLWGCCYSCEGGRGLGGGSALIPLSPQTVEHGFPSQPSALAYDPRLRVMAIGTKAGAVKLYPFLPPPPTPLQKTKH